MPGAGQAAAAPVAGSKGRAQGLAHPFLICNVGPGWRAPRCELLAARSFVVAGQVAVRWQLARGAPRPTALLHFCAVYGLAVIGRDLKTPNDRLDKGAFE